MPRGTKVKTKKLTDYEKKMLAEMAEARALLDEVGLSLFGFDPGVTAFFKPETGQAHVRGQGFAGEPVSFSRAEWKWLKPLLEELRDRRKGTK